MDFNYSNRVNEILRKLNIFMDTHIYTGEKIFKKQLYENSSKVPQIIEDLKLKAKKENLWNLFLPDEKLGPGLSNVEYATLCEVMGRSLIAPEIFNCNAPDTGNMELLIKYASNEQKNDWLYKLLEGKIRSAFCMTEPSVASSDATNITTSIMPDGDHYIINGSKWWTTNAAHPNCELLIVMGKTNPDAPKYKQQSQILVPMKTKGVKVIRRLTIYGYDESPHGHCELSFNNVRVPKSNLILGEGRGFEIAQGRLGPGRIHHCMRLIGAAERALEAMCIRSKTRVAFGKALSEQSSLREQIAQSRIDIDQARLLVLKTAWSIDQFGAKESRDQIAMIKVAVPKIACDVIDRSIQTHGAAGFTDDFFLAASWANSRGLRMADGPDAVHAETIAKLELKKFEN
ncbi:MAG: (R)-benzylsuccinyl-CoA dehydrogenase [Alphaproteobacteria bacterium MarineAlpha2_Bin1]|nr:MAG: (R)-benzylsuccinyl-CoA dehydrogenase [Alphaproteobacteria bacterium MarineAlpha2_Bin1]